MQEFLSQIAHEAGALAHKYYQDGTERSLKTNRHDFLTDADVAVSTFLVDKIHAKYPDHHIYSEEMAEDINSGAEYEWVIDPIDGTWNFANHIPNWGILIAVLKNDETLYAATYWPIDDYLFTAEKGKGAFLNGEKITVSTHEDLDNSAGYLFSLPSRPRAEVFASAAEKLFNAGARIKNYSCMYNAMLVTRGVFDFYAGNGGFDYDHLAPVLIAQEAGAVVTDSFGNPWKRDSKDLVIANSSIHPKLIEILK